jgi:hypothetical protein
MNNLLNERANSNKDTATLLAIKELHRAIHQQTGSNQDTTQTLEIKKNAPGETSGDRTVCMWTCAAA